MFSFLRNKLSEQSPAKKLFRMTIHVGRGTNTEMPKNLVGAYVPVFVTAHDHESAAHQAVSDLTRSGFEFIDMADQKIYEIDTQKWDEFVLAAWPEFVNHFPTQVEVVENLRSEYLFKGPFASYELEDNASS